MKVRVFRIEDHLGQGHAIHTPEDGYIVTRLPDGLKALGPAVKNILKKAYPDTDANLKECVLFEPLEEKVRVDTKRIMRCFPLYTYEINHFWDEYPK